ncbi:MAG: hypothetical protein AVDCRST_MAG55-3378, partial [uncultured Rubrobacteraceae bacterium]
GVCDPDRPRLYFRLSRYPRERKDALGSNSKNPRRRRLLGAAGRDRGSRPRRPGRPSHHRVGGRWQQYGRVLGIPRNPPGARRRQPPDQGRRHPGRGEPRAGLQSPRSTGGEQAAGAGVPAAPL